MAEMLSEKDKHGFIKDVYVAVGTFMCAFAFVMKYGGRAIIVLKPFQQHAVGKINVFAIHEELLVKSPTLG